MPTTMVKDQKRSFTISITRRPEWLRSTGGAARHLHGVVRASATQPTVQRGTTRRGFNACWRCNASMPDLGSRTTIKPKGSRRRDGT